ncbi:MAG TPA: beta-propeller domain-containing protein [Myxococcota bacterium]|nr:beta-propeller domain-containing protein [Myxococcota bacterium]
MILSVLIATGCNVRDPGYSLSAFKDCDALEKAVKGQAEEEIRWAYSWGGGGWGFGTKYDVSAQDSASMAAEVDDMDGGGSANRSYSDTNTQVSGVDEADLIETDGTHIYVLAGDSLVITKAWPAEDIDQIGRVGIEGIADGMFLTGDLLVVVSQLGWETPDPMSGGTSTRNAGNGPTVKTTIVDVSDPNVPTVQREVYTQGTNYDSRLVDGRLYVVSYSDLGINRTEWYENKKDALKAVEVSTLDDWLPGRFDNLRTGEAWASVDEDVSRCSNVYGSNRESGNYMVNVESLDIEDPDSDFVGTSVLGSLDAIYANAESLYVVGSEAADGPWQSFDSTIETIIHRFDISGGPEEPSYQASGEVPGWVLNQFAMDEWDGHLRIATTAADPEGWDTSAGLYVLEEQSNSDLEIVGEVEGLAEGEQIFAVRFEEEVGYVVTFEQIDPLFTFDLSDHAAPEAVGELEITGFSNYIHPMGDGYLLAVGMEATDEGWAENLQVSMFDVNDLADPQLSSRLQLSADWSESQSDHHAFNWYAPESRLLLPAGWGYDSEMLLIHAAVGEELVEIAGVDQDEVLYDGGDVDEYCSSFRRSVVIEDAAYAISNAGITVVDVEDAEPLGFVAFSGTDPCASEYYYW